MNRLLSLVLLLALCCLSWAGQQSPTASPASKNSKGSQHAIVGLNNGAGNVLKNGMKGYMAGNKDAGTILTFDDANNLGVTLGGNMQWRSGGHNDSPGHLYCEMWNTDDYIYFATPTTVNNFYMNSLYESSGSGQGTQTINAYDLNNNLVWTQVVDLTAYNNWSNWLQVIVNTDNISKMEFIQTTTTGTFWPSIDDMTINGGVPVNNPPVITEADPATLTTSMNVAKNITFNATDADDAATLSWSVKTQAGHGVVAVLADKSTSSQKSFSYTPTTGYTGNDVFVIEVSDGTAADDITVNVTVNEPPAGNCLNFDGIDDYVVTSYNPDESSAATYTAWVYPTSSTGEKMILGTCGSTTSGWLGFWMEINGSMNPRVFYQGTTSFILADVVPLNTWTHFAVTFEASAVKFYINGVLKDSRTLSSPINDDGGNLYIGAIGPLSTSSWIFNGGIDEVSCWNRALSEAEISSYKDNGLNGNESGLKLYYQFNQGVAGGDNALVTTLFDKTANANNGELHDFALVGLTSNWINSSIIIGTPNNPPVITEADPAALATTMNVAKNITLNATDADDAAILSWSVKTQAGHGVVAVLADKATAGQKSFSYTPATGYTGNDVFVIEVSDGIATDDITVNVTVNEPAKPDILLMHDDESCFNDVKAKLNSTGMFKSITGFIPYNNTPTLDYLKNYQAVLIWNGYSQFVDPNSFGNVLADYVDWGGGVVCAVFTMTNQGSANWMIGGRFNADNYWAIAPSTGQKNGQASLGTVHQPSHELMTGVVSFDGGTSSFRPTSTDIAAGATRIADWSDGVPLIAARSVNGHNRVDLGFFPASSDVGGASWWNSTTDGAKIMANALTYVAGPSPSAISTTKALPTEYSLDNNYPNPFNNTTSISYSLPNSSKVEISIYNISGQKVMTLLNGKMSAGKHTICFDAAKLASGTYFYSLQTEGKQFMKKMLLLK